MKIKSLIPMLSMIPAVFRGVEPGDIETIKRITRVAFPAVRQISTSDLTKWIATPEDIMLVDVRSEPEFEISHLKGALNARSAFEIQKSLTNPETKVVLYCSVGFRSASLAEKMQKRGFRNAFNLEGSIFQWVNEERPIYTGNLPARQVHPFSTMWSGLLKTGLARKL